MLRWTPLLAALALGLAGCDECADYCELECACDDQAGDACVETCLDTMEVYDGEARQEECGDRLEQLQRDCG